MKLRYVMCALALSCGGSSPGAEHAAAPDSPQAQADAFLATYNPFFVALYTESSRAAWVASTDVSEQHTGMRTGADTAFGAFAGNALVIERARELLTHE